MSVLIHPVLTRVSGQHALKQMLNDLGLRATASGHLVLPNGNHPAMRAAKHPQLRTINPSHGPYNGGGAAA